MKEKGMGYQIYELADGQRIALYAQGNSIFSCLLPFGRGMIPTEVKNDYLACFDAVIFRDTLIFVYKNMEQKVVISSLGSAPPRIVLTEGAGGYDFDNLKLVVRDGVPVLFYSARCGRSEGYGLYACLPYREGQKSVLKEGSENPFHVVQVLKTEWTQVWTIEEKSGQTHRFFWKNELDFEEIRQISEKDLLEENERIRSKYELKLAEITKEHKKQLENVKKQYDELADTAFKLQAAGKRWREKYLEGK